jgi:aminoacyl tRNA synthase complex-interacting multifunctional protein 1
MANFNEQISSALKEYYHSRATSILAENAEPLNASQKLFPNITYSDVERKEIQKELERASKLEAASAKNAQPDSKELRDLNNHLAQRTVLLGAKPSIADVVLYAKLAPALKNWTREQRTGQEGYHNVVRYVDFVQNSDVFALQLPDVTKVAIDPTDVAFVPKPVDLKREKEQKRKEKEKNAAAAGNAEAGEGKSKKEKVKDVVTNAKETAKGAIAGELPKREKKEKPAKQGKGQPAKELVLSPSLIDLRVGHILKAVQHPNADSLYVSTIAVGDPTGTDNTEEYEGQVVRTVCSGLNGFVPLEDMQGRKIVAVCNLKPITMRGIKSSAMVLAASPRTKEGEDSHAGPIELVNPPEGATAGQRIWFEGYEAEPEGQLNPKKKIWELCQPGFKTTNDLQVAFEKAPVEAIKEQEDKPAEGKLRVKDGGYCTVKSLKGATVR